MNRTILIGTPARVRLTFTLAAVVLLAGSAAGQVPRPPRTLDAPAPLAALAAPNGPSDLRILPDYSATKAAVLFFEDFSGDETKFEIERKEGAGAYAKVKELAANDATVERTVEWTDTPLDGTKTYTYRVRAVNNDGASGYTNECVLNFATAWAADPNDIEILHGFGDGLGLNGERMHHGIDIQGGGGGQDVRPARTALAFALVGAGDNRGVWLMYLEDGVIWHWHANHLDQIDANVGSVAYGTVETYRTITAGTRIGRMTQTTWAAPWNHVHVQFNRNGVEGAGSWTARLKNNANYMYDEDRFRHGLSIHSGAQKDPKEKKPAPADANANTRTIEFNNPDGTDYGYDAATKPLAGDVDVAVELYDEMGTDPANTVDRVRWWIAPPAGGDPAKNAVRSSGTPYTLVYFSQNYMKDVNWDVIYDSARSTKPAGYPWENYHHYILTNTKSGNGQPASLDKDQVWRTKAKQDNSDVNADTANMTGKDEATKAAEARFPDGEYTVHVKLSDLVNSDEPHKWEKIRVDNFPPAVVKIEEADGGGTPVAPGTCPQSIRITFSEPVLHVEHEDITLADPNDDPVGVVYITDPNDPRVVILIFDVPMSHLARYTLTISRDVKDKSDKRLDSRFGESAHNGTGGEAGDGVTHSFCFCQSSADLNGDDLVNQADLDIMMDAFGTASGDADYVECLDYDQSGQIDFIDLQVWWSLQ